VVSVEMVLYIYGTPLLSCLQNPVEVSFDTKGMPSRFVYELSKQTLSDATNGPYAGYAIGHE
jgi:hypothetical protein